MARYSGRSCYRNPRERVLAQSRMRSTGAGHAVSGQSLLKSYLRNKALHSGLNNDSWCFVFFELTEGDYFARFLQNLVFIHNTFPK